MNLPEGYKQATFKSYETYAMAVPEGTIVVSIKNHTSLRQVLAHYSDDYRMRLNQIFKSLDKSIILPPPKYASKLLSMIKPGIIGAVNGHTKEERYADLYNTMLFYLKKIPDGGSYIAKSNFFLILENYSSLYEGNQQSALGGDSKFVSAVYKTPEFSFASASKFAHMYQIEYRGNFCNIDMNIFNQLKNKDGCMQWRKCRFMKEHSCISYIAKPTVVQSRMNPTPHVSSLNVIGYSSNRVVSNSYMAPREFANKVDLRNWSKEFSGYVAEPYTKPVDII